PCTMSSAKTSTKCKTPAVRSCPRDWKSRSASPKWPTCWPICWPKNKAPNRLQAIAWTTDRVFQKGLRMNMKRTIALLLVVIVALGLHASAADAADGWKAGAAKVVITPTAPIWMSGYLRDHPGDG